jgi:hypothetical protein
MFLKVGNAKLRCYKNKACILYVFDVIYCSVFDSVSFSVILLVTCKITWVKHRVFLSN